MHKIYVALNKEKNFDVNYLLVNEQPLLLSSRNSLSESRLDNFFGLRTIAYLRLPKLAEMIALSLALIMPSLLKSAASLYPLLPLRLPNAAARVVKIALKNCYICFYHNIYQLISLDNFTVLGSFFY